MPKLRACLHAIAVAALVVGADPNAQVPRKHLLRHAFRDGSVARFESVVETKSESFGDDGEKQVSVSSIRAVEEMRIELHHDGGALVSLELVYVQGNAVFPDGTRYEFDSASELDMDPEHFEIAGDRWQALGRASWKEDMRKLVGVSRTDHMDDRGRPIVSHEEATAVEETSSGAAAGLHMGGYARFPDGPVAVGETWTSEYEERVSDVSVQVEMASQLVSVEGSVATIQWKMVVSYPRGPLIERLHEGSIRYDLSDYCTQSSERTTVTELDDKTLTQTVRTRRVPFPDDDRAGSGSDSKARR